MAEEDAIPHRGDEGAGSIADGAPRRGRILVVDDNADVRESLGDLLDAAGYQVTEADSGESALDYLNERGGARVTDLILLDFCMPHMTGAEFVTARAAHAALAQIPVVFITADERARSAAVASGCDCLSKPLQLDDLVSVVERRMAGR